ncbi:transposase [Corallococcus coralloides DSM 2259]|uniref:Transposase n=1 Tax=Corallococcus coralloides (strain ATCC 25202 / DSM 2259 / NBRC 100086 / M2) TaxID=1144275 RepID=H8MG69_CORCM|nr:transposase [Corallococcus coralloides DSM 2259]
MGGGDEVYGRDTTLRRFLEDLHQPYVLAVASNTHVWRGFCQVKPGDMVKEIPPEAWARLSAGAGTKGPRLYDWARMRLNRHLGLSRGRLFRRSLADGKVAFYVAHARRNSSLESLVRAAGSRWAVEEDFESAKGEVGLANHEVRTWTAWHRHMTLCLVARVSLRGPRSGWWRRWHVSPAAFVRSKLVELHQQWRRREVRFERPRQSSASHDCPPRQSRPSRSDEQGQASAERARLVGGVGGAVVGQPFDGVELLRADTHRGWGIASMARAAARWARFS